ncbi:MAG: RNA methyltransferase [Ruminococcaceae bacterium]|nr:RNA methyltransferase [Oscillospiraceae bacterium]
MIIESRKNQTVVKSRGLLSEKKLREKEGLIAAEGVKLCTEALDAGLQAEYAVVSEEAEKKYSALTERLRGICPVYIVTRDVYFSLSQQKTPQGIFLALKLLDKSKNLDRILEKNKIILLDCIQDSGNLGTIIRTAEAFGIEGAILSSDCADPYSPKTLRASMGSGFRLPVCVSSSLEKTVLELKENGFETYAAMLDETAQRLGEFEFPQKCALIIGNEGHGVSEAVAGLCRKVYIPIRGAESLNAAAAAAVICYEMGK